MRPIPTPPQQHQKGRACRHTTPKQTNTLTLIVRHSTPGAVKKFSKNCCYTGPQKIFNAKRTWLRFTFAPPTNSHYSVQCTSTWYDHNASLVTCPDTEALETWLKVRWSFERTNACLSFTPRHLFRDASVHGTLRSNVRFYCYIPEIRA